MVRQFVNKVYCIRCQVPHKKFEYCTFLKYLFRDCRFNCSLLSLRISVEKELLTESDFEPLMPGGNKKVTHT